MRLWLLDVQLRIAAAARSQRADRIHPSKLFCNGGFSPELPALSKCP